MRCLSSILAVLLLLTAGASSAESTYTRAEKALEELEFELAVRLYKKALSEPGARSERIGTYRGLGLVSSYQGDGKTAKVYFEKLLLMDPQAKIDTALGPKITKPFDLAKKAIGTRKNTLSLTRGPSGQVLLELRQDVVLATELSLNARAKETDDYKSVTTKVGASVMMDFQPTDPVQAWAQALDEAGGIIYEQGTQDAPLRFPASKLTAKPVEPPAVTAAREEAKKEDLGAEIKSDDGQEPSARGYWPWIVGATAVVGAGVAAGLVISNQPPPPNLPPADHTIDLQ